MENIPLEIERKWVVPKHINIFSELNLDHGTLFTIHQGYSTEIRLRKKVHCNSKYEWYYQTIKKGQGLVKKEYEIELTKEQFDTLWPLTEECRLIKKRRVIKWNQYIIELDCIVLDDGSSFNMIEIEFATEKAAKIFIAPPEFGKEVTEDKRYNNFNIARTGKI